MPGPAGSLGDLLGFLREAEGPMAMVKEISRRKSFARREFGLRRLMLKIRSAWVRVIGIDEGALKFVGCGGRGRLRSRTWEFIGPGSSIFDRHKEGGGFIVATYWVSCANAVRFLSIE